MVVKFTENYNTCFIIWLLVFSLFYTYDYFNTIIKLFIIINTINDTTITYKIIIFINIKIVNISLVNHQKHLRQCNILEYHQSKLTGPLRQVHFFLDNYIILILIFSFKFMSKTSHSI